MQWLHAFGLFKTFSFTIYPFVGKPSFPALTHHIPPLPTTEPVSNTPNLSICEEGRDSHARKCIFRYL